MAKRLIVCADGTWNSPERADLGFIQPSNVAKLVRVLPRIGDGVEQKVFYGKGVGTGLYDRLRGGVFGWGLSDHIKDCYRFIVDNFEPGDDIYLFGFSRGAYTARSTAGLIRNSGILIPEYRDRIDEAYDLYRRRDLASQPRGSEAELFRRTCSNETRIKFIGVWDTVGALGIPTGIAWLPPALVSRLNKRWEFHDVKLSSSVDNAFHAVAIDEHRPPFTPTLWQQQAHATEQRLEQVWFVGAHGNIGGGSPDPGLSDFSFLWMKDRAKECGLVFDEDRVGELFHPNPLGPVESPDTWLYSRFKATLREIGVQENGNEKVHHAARDRLLQDPTYQASNLRVYLDRGGAVTEESP
jgi:uncharacterized protein (DUF2235 family)